MGDAEVLDLMVPVRSVVGTLLAKLDLPRAIEIVRHKEI